MKFSRKWILVIFSKNIFIRISFSEKTLKRQCWGSAMFYTIPKLRVFYGQNGFWWFSKSFFIRFSKSFFIRISLSEKTLKRQFYLSNLKKYALFMTCLMLRFCNIVYHPKIEGILWAFYGHNGIWWFGSKSFLFIYLFIRENIEEAISPFNQKDRVIKKPWL